MDDYTAEELDALNEEQLRNSGEELFSGNPETFETGSLGEMKFCENKNVFAFVKALITDKETLHLEFGIGNGSPYYRLPNRSMLFLNKEILHFIYSWLEEGIISSQTPQSFIGLKYATEIYMLRLLQRDDKNHAIQYNPTEGYKAVYERGTIYYGNSDCTLEEMKAKLNSL